MPERGTTPGLHQLSTTKIVAGDQLPTGYYHVVVLSNFCRGFDKYSRRYDKSEIPESSYASQFFLLQKDQIHFGMAKANRLIEKLGIGGNCLLLMRCKLEPDMALFPNTRTGIGQFVKSTSVQVDELYLFRNTEDDLRELDASDSSMSHQEIPEAAETQEWLPVSFEKAQNLSLKLLYGEHPNWSSLTPRSVSVLPIAMGCQAKCSFCFSHTSISADQSHEKINFNSVAQILKTAKKRGATRAVITGGGEPGLMPFPSLVELVACCKSIFDKVVMISNGYFISNKSEATRRERLFELDKAGLSVLSISRHHFDEEKNTAIMQLETKFETIAQTLVSIQQHLGNLKLRLVCVLQKGGIECESDIDAFISFAANAGVSQVCFKELYVSTSEESVYFDSRYNLWSQANQVSLRHVLSWAQNSGCTKVAKLPWGSPVYRSTSKHTRLAVDVAAYTEPSVFWELNNGICRSWNIMADGSCYASLEDRNSIVHDVGALAKN